MKTGHPACPSRCRSGRTPALAAFALFAVLPLVSGAGPEEALVAPLADHLRAPSLRCEWIGGEFGAIEQSLSLYRQELASIHVAVDGRTVGDSAGGAILAVEFDTWREGPASMAIAIDASRLSSPASLTPGRRLEAWFTDRGGQPHPLFCGELAVLRADAATKRIDLLAVLPRTGDEGRSDATYGDTTCVDVLKRLAATNGLALEVEDRRRREVFPTLERKQLADWPFIRQLARQCAYEIVFAPGGTLRVADSGFSPPVAPRRQWSDVTLSHIAREIARTMGREVDARLTASYPKIAMIQILPDADFLASTALMFQVSAWFEPGRVMLAEDGVWRTPPSPVAALMAGTASTPDELQLRILVTGSPDGRRSFTRVRTDRALRQSDPENLPVVQTTLLLGRTMRVAQPLRFELADYAATGTALERAIMRLEQSTGQTAERRFLIGYARSFRPTFIHVYRRTPGGLQTLDAIKP